MGGSHHSIVVEFNEYVAVAEAPLNEERSLAVLAEAKKLVPNKPVRYVLTTHHHFDHSGGLRTYVAEGATVVTHQSNVPYFEKTLTAPATLALAQDQQGRVVVTHAPAFGRSAISADTPFVGIVYLRPGHPSATFVLGVIDALRESAVDLEPPFVVVAERREATVRVRARTEPPW
jgi:glyoxylase-like metal-dependent hydrolase (beta-lactamase superfamily II)